MENTDNWNECFMPVVSSENNNESFFSKLKLVGSIELLMIYLKNEGYIVSSDPKKNNNTDLFAPKIFYYESIAPKTKKIFIVKNSLLDSGLLSIFFNKDSSYNINPNLKNYLKDSRYPNLIEFVPIKYNNNLSYSPKEESQFKKESLTPLILKAFEHNHIKVKHREKELEILFFENKQELYNSINKP
ncbi:hypothetical protein E5D94_03215 [Helicobacter pylori]|nr:hypothetical protein E5D94_03215 [Helicobacter pylori]